MKTVLIILSIIFCALDLGFALSDAIEDRFSFVSAVNLILGIVLARQAFWMIRWYRQDQLNKQIDQIIEAIRRARIS